VLALIRVGSCSLNQCLRARLFAFVGCVLCLRGELMLTRGSCYHRCRWWVLHSAAFDLCRLADVVLIGDSCILTSHASIAYGSKRRVLISRCGNLLLLIQCRLKVLLGAREQCWMGSYLASRLLIVCSRQLCSRCLRRTCPCGVFR